MNKHPLSDALARAEMHLKKRQDERRLEQAAPDLLAALRGLVAEFEKFSRYGSPIARDANEALRRARAAITLVDGPDR